MWIDNTGDVIIAEGQIEVLNGHENIETYIYIYFFSKLRQVK